MHAKMLDLVFVLLCFISFYYHYDSSIFLERNSCIPFKRKLFTYSSNFNAVGNYSCTYQPPTQHVFSRTSVSEMSKLRGEKQNVRSTNSHLILLHLIAFAMWNRC